MGTRIAYSVLTLVALLVIAGVVWAAMAFVTVRLGIASSYWLVPVFGALGGMVGGILRSDNKLELCSFDGFTKVNLGIVGDIVSGLGGASALVFLFGGTLLKFDPKQAESLVLIVSVSFVAGAFGKNIVEAAGEKLLRKAKEEARHVAKEEARILVGPSAALAYTHAAREATNRGEPGQALQIVQVALENDPNHAGAYVEQGRALKRLGRLNEALEAVEKALKVSPNKAEALYNRACYKSLLGQPASSVAPDLRKALELLPSLRKLASNDHDLDNIRNAKEIKDIIENPNPAG